MPWAPIVSETNGRPTGLISAELDELAAARRHAFDTAQTKWIAYQKARHGTKEKAQLRNEWQKAEIDAIRATKQWSEALEEGLSGS